MYYFLFFWKMEITNNLWTSVQEESNNESPIISAQIKNTWNKVIEKLSEYDKKTLLLKLTILADIKDNNSIEFIYLSDRISDQYNIDLLSWSSFFKTNHQLFGYKNNSWKYQYFTITDNCDIKKFSFEFDEKINFISNDWENLDNIFEWIISWEKSIFEIDDENNYITYLLREKNIHKVSKTKLKNIINITYKKPWTDIYADVISIYNNYELFSIINNWYSDIEIENNWLVTWENKTENKYFIWVIENSEFIFLKEFSNKAYLYLINLEENNPNSNSFISISEWGNTNTYILDINNAKFENIENWNILKWFDHCVIDSNDLIDFLNWQKMLIVKNSVYAFNTELNLVILLKTFDKNSDYYMVDEKLYCPKKWYILLDGKIYKKTLFKKTLIKYFETQSDEDFEKYFERVSIDDGQK